MADADITDLEIAALCDLLEGPRANLKAHKKSVLDQLLAKGLVKPAHPQDSNLLTRLNTFSRNAASDLAVARPIAAHSCLSSMVRGGCNEPNCQWSGAQ